MNAHVDANVTINENVQVNVNYNALVDESVNGNENIHVTNNAIIPRGPASLHEFVTVATGYY